MTRGQKARPGAAPPGPLTRPQWLAVLLVAAAVVVLGVSYPLYDPDVWQHLRVGKAIWETHSIPRTNVWTWPGFGEPYVLPSWLFRALLWPVYAVAGAWGLELWRWLVTLATFAIAGATARRMGARGLAVVLAIVWCALLYRLRSMVRPEMLAGLLLAVQMWILEERRRGGRDRSAWLVLVAWLWANAHMSYYLPLVLTGFHVLAEGLSVLRHRPGARWPVRLALVLGASAGICFLNPFGWAGLWGPFEYFFELRNEPLYRMILELRPIVWRAHVLDGLPLWMVLAPGLCLWRWLRGRGDLVDTLVYALFFALALQSQRFLGLLTVAAAPIFARDVAGAVGGLRLPASLRAGWARVALAVLVLVLGAAPQLAVRPWRPGPPLEWRAFPVRACDWIERHGVRGRSFGAFHLAGYQLWRFWPERERLPFMDVHMTATPRADRDLYAACWGSDEAWRALDREHRFDFALLPATQFPGQDLLDRLDADTTWALVFADDAAALYLRRDGRLARLARSEAYEIVPAGERILAARLGTLKQDPAGRARIRAELERMAGASEWSWRAHNMLATLDLLDARWADALEALERTRALNPDAPQLAERERMARDALAAGR